jgi:DNA-binding transcriptional LysR family regulator
MELRHIRTFLALAEELHFGRTAQRLRVAQSAVSQTLKALELEVGAELLARTRRTVALTPAGERFLEHARQALRELEDGTRAARSAAAGESGPLTLRFVLMSALTLLPRTISRFQRQYPRVSLQIAQASTAEQLEAIRAGRCDLGFVAAAVKGEVAPLASEVVESASLVAVLPGRHRLAARRSLRLADLAGDRFVFLRPSSEPQVLARFRLHCRAAGFEPDIAVEVDHSEALLAFVASGLGVSCAPSLIQRLPFRGVVTVPLKPDVWAGISVVWHPQLLTATGARFLDTLRSEIAAAEARPRVRAARSRTRTARATRPPERT